MQYVNDDMDELFRRAAENYPLDTNSADWSKVAAALQGVGTTALKAERKGKTNSRLLWLLLLLPLGLICNQLYTPGGEPDNTARTVSEKKTPDINNQILTADQNRPSNSQTPVIDLNKSDNPVAATLTDEKITADKTANTPGTGNSAIKQNTLIDQAKPNNATGSEKETLKKSPDYSYPSGSQPPSSVSNAVPETAFSGENQVSGRKYISSITRDKTDKSPIAIDRPLTPVANPVQNRKKPYEKGSKGFYFGVMGGIDFTTVKFQKFEEKGFTHGIIAGYQINTNFSIETGIFKENKYYYSDGKYFNTSGISVRPNSKITEVSGECNMYEVPVNVKYNFSGGRKTWFVSAGTSSYIMKKEDYTYTYYSSSYGPYPVHKQYLNSSQNLFAIANISGGFIHQIGNFADLRIEPYIKVPLSGLGIGKLPLLSTGLNIGITKKF